jgi:hypothetical protein
MPWIEIWHLDSSPAADTHMWERHGVYSERLFEVIRGNYIVFRNRAQRAASHLLIGNDAHGRCLTAPILPTDDIRVWRPLTAWPCKKSEAARLAHGR